MRWRGFGPRDPVLGVNRLNRLAIAVFSWLVMEGRQLTQCVKATFLKLDDHPHVLPTRDAGPWIPESEYLARTQLFSVTVATENSSFRTQTRTQHSVDEAPVFNFVVWRCKSLHCAYECSMAHKVALNLLEKEFMSDRKQKTLVACTCVPIEIPRGNALGAPIFLSDSN